MSTNQRKRFPGAASFSDDRVSRALFFGRKEEMKTLQLQIAAHRLTTLFARSGVGKTSLLAAGVSEELRVASMLPLFIRLNDVNSQPMEILYNCIGRECARQGIDYVPGRADGLWSFCKTTEFWREDVLLTPVLIFDQFEEIFTLQAAARREILVSELSFVIRGVRPPTLELKISGPNELALLNEYPPDVRVLFSLREDFLPNLEELADRIPQVLDQRFRLLPLTRTRAEEALTCPASVDDARLGLETRPFDITSDLRKLILDFLSRQSPGVRASSRETVEPFQLQLICEHIEAIAARKQQMSDATMVAVGTYDVRSEQDLMRVMRDYYMKKVRQVQGFINRKRVVILCTEYLISAQGRRVRLEAEQIFQFQRLKEPVLDQLVAAHLLRVDPVDGAKYYELIHDSLIGAILLRRRFVLVGRILTSAVTILCLGLVAAALLMVLVVLPTVLVPYSEESDPASREKTIGVALFFFFVGLILLRPVFQEWRTLRANWFLYRRRQWWTGKVVTRTKAGP